MSDTDGRLRVVVGLGNPGSKYNSTRHNVGFEVLNQLSQRYSAALPRAKFDGQLTTVTVFDTKLMLVWPLTYMNDSGRCVQAVTRFYKTDVEQDLLVVCDDLSLPLGKLRIRGKGSAGGQKGLRSILQSVGSQSVPRLRVGIDQPPPGWDAVDYVLGRFRNDEKEVVQETVLQACDAIGDWCQHGLAHCMNKYN